MNSFAPLSIVIDSNFIKFIIESKCGFLTMLYVINKEIRAHISCSGFLNFFNVFNSRALQYSCQIQRFVLFSTVGVTLEVRSFQSIYKIFSREIPGGLINCPNQVTKSVLIFQEERFRVEHLDLSHSV